MKRLVLGSLGTLLIATATTPVLASEIAANSTTSRNNIVEVQPFNLVYLGYQGYFADQGIPSNAAFISAIKSKRITAKDLVASAIARGRLSPETINDSTYLAHVNTQLFNLDKD
ncbi:MAG: hypothetical protein F6J90_37435 [Moorea sp. SIOASIH]|uniref:hypothetical protein n=1 Tax=Moorena sp. SIOASIH TaxID=2607817 RepID=UPI0013BE6B56|nr:hypothetical protein [Moorena sp. SIOASIH]NEO41703.1 hypothetical protein [Moorena sp. SIOASIH]NEO95186.1 hypothetical protein [Moorena sp. SIO3G5]